jgi:hypothetical protein
VSDSVENMLEKIVKDVAAILYVVQIPLDIFNSCFVFEDVQEASAVGMDTSEEAKLVQLSENLEKILGFIQVK